ncbi:helix-turn-helix domain-containing protein [Actinomyces faecalis]|uniref:helix-turn-helix domain-containing protein n=1 Tax=Actinomyces faecalis TaxID=2722820 RepID=UPI0015539D12|nr:helix-turn-helix domain-containing protein [Actinomyces faecalis]
MNVVEQTLTTVQVAQVLSCSRQRVESLCRSGVLAAVQMEPGGPYRIRPQALAEYVAAQEAAVAARAAQRAAVAERDLSAARVRDMVATGQVEAPRRVSSSPHRRRRLYRRPA